MVLWAVLHEVAAAGGLCLKGTCAAQIKIKTGQASICLRPV